MSLSWNEIKDRALKFSREWENETRERAEKDSFWNDFFYVFGISRRRTATFEKPVKKLGGNQGFIDLFWKGTLIVEHKSKGKNLEKAYRQAIDYFPGLKEHELPKYILVSDFQRFKLYDLDEKSEHEFHISEFYKNVKLFGFIAGYQKRTFKEEDPVNIHAAELMGEFHDILKEFGYAGHSLEVYLVRLLFILFADDTGIFEKDIFRDFIEQKTSEDGRDLGAWTAQIFQTLNRPRKKRLKNLNEHLNQFPYVNGGLFEEALPIASFNSEMRNILLQASSLDWGKISPAVFGSLFQSVMNPEERRNTGAHYTSEKNILKLIKPLFLDELENEFEKVKANTKKLQQFHKKLSKLKFLDPACGSGNFLIIAYRELRLLEIKILRELYKKGEIVTDISHIVWIDVDQFFGIEYDEFASKIAEAAMWLIDHQMNMRISEEFGQYFVRLPLKKSAKIINANSLQINWEDVVPKQELTYILGNPPFIGSKLLDKFQREDMAKLFHNVKNGKTLDYVSAWYLKAAQYIQNTKIKTAFVSTNSITQGEQVSVLWGELMNNYQIKIHFAHTAFKWSNEAKGKAAVYCVIIGFANYAIANKKLYTYEDIKGDPDELKVKNINPYLANAKDVIIDRKNKPICEVPKMAFGNMPLDGGNFLFAPDEKENFIKSEPKAEKYFLPLISAKEFLNNKKRWCLWLENISPQELHSMPKVMERVQAVKDFRLNSVAPSTQKHALTPTLFRDRKRPKTFIVIPRVSSENRKYIPMGFFTKEYIAGDTCLVLLDAALYHFGVLMSEMHMTWVKYTCGRLESRFRYSKDVVYNNYPWAKAVSEKNKKKAEAKAQKVLDVRAEFPESSLADLYHPLTMPPKLVKAHKELDKAVDLCYRPQAFASESARIEYLFDLYNEYTAPLFKKEKKRRKKKA
ncbi:MAG: SAM-dependent methyltransferase [Candidatus Cloacimonadota bacterium]|nr:MAG: SAM-dependent methyltransferase [Candidatus Cloacimonadota bacterium]